MHSSLTKNEAQMHADRLREIAADAADRMHAAPVHVQHSTVRHLLARAERFERIAQQAAA